MKLLKKIFYYTMGFCLITGCKPSTTTGQEEKPSTTITVSIEPLRYITEQIAGPRFKVITLVPKGSSPETYEPTPEQMMNLSKGLIYFQIGGLGFEQTWKDKLQQAAPDVTFVNTSDGIQHVKGHHHGTDGRITSDIDPHIWTSPSHMGKIAQNICTALCQADTANAHLFQKNLQKALAEIQATDDSIRTLLEKHRQKAFLIYHPALTYFSQDYGLEQIPIETEGKEPSPAQLVDIIRRCKEKNVRTIFVQQEFDQKNAEIIAKETGTHIVTINPLSYDWKKEMLNIAQNLQQP